MIMAVTLKNKARTLVGLVSAQAADNREFEIGYVVAPPQAGRGFATEAVTTLVDAVFNMTEARTINGNCRTINPASRRVLEKCGFAALGPGLQDLPARGGKHPCDYFGLTRHEWSSRAKTKGLGTMKHQAARDPIQDKDAYSQQQQQQQ